MPRSFRRPAISTVLALAALVVAVAGRIAAADVIRRDPAKAIWPDSGGYVTLSRAIAEGEDYRDPAGSATDLMRPPGYPAFLALFFKLSGDRPLVPVTAQLALGCLVGWLVYRTGSAAGSRSAGLVGGLLYAMTPNAVLWATAVLSDTLFTFLIALAFLALISSHRRLSLFGFSASGLTVGLAILVRPVGLIVLPIWSLWVAAIGWKHRWPAARSLASAGVFLASSLAVILPWCLRNAREYGLFTVSPINTWNLGRYHAPYTLMRADGLTLDEARARVPTSRVPQPGDRARYLSVLVEHPLDYLYVYARGTWYVLGEAGQPNIAQLVGERFEGPGVGEALSRGRLLAALESLASALGDPARRWFVLVPWTALLIQAVVYLSAVWGALRLLRSRSPAAAVAAVAALTALAFILAPGPVGTGRFRLPAEPFLALLAGLGLAGVSARSRSEREPVEEGGRRSG